MRDIDSVNSLPLATLDYAELIALRQSIEITNYFYSYTYCRVSIATEESLRCISLARLKIDSSCHTNSGCNR